MSSILKALKKAEEESPDSESLNRSPLRLNVRTTLSSRMLYQRQRFFFDLKGFLFIFCAALAMASALFLLLFPDKTLQSGPSPRVAPPQSYWTAAFEKNDQKISAPSVEKSQTPPKLAEQNNIDQKMERFPPLVEKNHRPEEQDIEKNHSETASQPPAKPGLQREEILPMKDGTLNIQAISWAKNPLDRIAVINTKIVGEGDFVQDYRILEIGKDEVIFQLSNQKFRLAFKYR